MNDIWITPSLVLEYLFCKRFIYFMNCLNIPQNEGKRFVVNKGREVHEERKKMNPDYLKKKLGVKQKLIDVPLFSNKYLINGKVDEILFLNDGTGFPLDYKYAYNERNFKTYFFQCLMYCLMIEENYNIKSKKGFICFTREKYKIKEINFIEKDIEKLQKILDDIRKISTTCIMPTKKASLRKCADCTYRKTCV